MTVFALWSAPRTRSTAFFRSMVERGDMTAIHEPFCKLRDFDETEAGGRTFDSPFSLLAWLLDETDNTSVFVKDHPPIFYLPDVVADRRSSPRSGERHEHVYEHTVENSPDLARYAPEAATRLHQVLDQIDLIDLSPRARLLAQTVRPVRHDPLVRLAQ
jgi:hypothetical protein